MKMIMIAAELDESMCLSGVVPGHAWVGKHGMPCAEQPSGVDGGTKVVFWNEIRHHQIR